MDDLPKLKYMEPVCPDCGSSWIDVEYGNEGLLPLDGEGMGVKCGDCGCEFPLTNENGREVKLNSFEGPS